MEELISKKYHGSIYDDFTAKQRVLYCIIILMPRTGINDSKVLC